MAYVRFFRRIKIAPGLTMNLSKGGASLSCGVRGAHITVGRTGVRKTVGMPGTGIFYTSHSGYHTGVHTGGHFREGQAAPPTGPATKSTLFTLLLCVLLGYLGVHRFYAGRFLSGAIMLVLTLTLYGAFITVLWWLVDLLMIVTGQFHDGCGNKMRW